MNALQNSWVRMRSIPRGMQDLGRSTGGVPSGFRVGSSGVPCGFQGVKCGFRFRLYSISKGETKENIAQTALAK